MTAWGKRTHVLAAPGTNRRSATVGRVLDGIHHRPPAETETNEARRRLLSASAFRCSYPDLRTRPIPFLANLPGAAQRLALLAFARPGLSSDRTVGAQETGCVSIQLTGLLGHRCALSQPPREKNSFEIRTSATNSRPGTGGSREPSGERETTNSTEETDAHRSISAHPFHPSHPWLPPQLWSETNAPPPRPLHRQRAPRRSETSTNSAASAVISTSTRKPITSSGASSSSIQICRTLVSKRSVG